MNLKSCRVRDFMAGRLVKFTPDTDMLDAIHELVHHRIAGAPVVDEQGELVGMLSETDCLKVALGYGDGAKRIFAWASLSYLLSGFIPFRERGAVEITTAAARVAPLITSQTG